MLAARVNVFIQEIFKSRRNRNFYLSGFITIICKGIYFLLQLITVPFLVSKLGIENFGLYSVLISLLAFMSFADLGLGFGIVNFLPAYISTNNTDKIRQVISTTFYLLLFCSILLLTFCFFCQVIHLPIDRIINHSTSISPKSINNCFYIIALFFSVSLPFSIYQKIYHSYQQGFLVEIWALVGNVIGFAALLSVASKTKEVSYILICLQGTSCIITILAFFVVNKVKSLSFPSFRIADKKLALTLLKIGLGYLFMQLMYIVTNNIDNVILAKKVNLSTVTVYSSYIRLVYFFTLPFVFLINPLLPALNDAFVKEDLFWIKKKLSSFLHLFLLIGLVLGACFFLFSDFIIRLWIGKSFPISGIQRLSFSLYLFYTLINSIFSTVAMTNFYFKKAIKYYIYILIITVITKLSLIYFNSISIENLLFSTVSISFAFFICPVFIKLKKAQLIK